MTRFIFSIIDLLLVSAAASSIDIDLGTAGNFAILSKAGITDVYSSSVNGNVGTSPITGSAIHLQCSEVTGTVYVVDAAGPSCSVVDPSMLTIAISDMAAAYTQAAGLSNPDFLNLGGGNIGGMTLTPGLYNWDSNLLIPTDITISGSSDDTWVFQIAGTLILSNGVVVNLSNGAQASNIVWQVAGAVTLGTTSHFEGVLLGKTSISLQTGASANSKLLAQTGVTLEMNVIQ
jgi:hypothetical protein